MFRYVEPEPARPGRALIEGLGLLVLGFAQYMSNRDANERDWDNDYSWSTVGAKLSGSKYSLDTNTFDTNYVGHAGSGTLYYLAARGNRLPIWTSFVFAATASTLWEIFGELREDASINDLVVTPVTGLVLGESTLQHGAFFDRSCAGPANRVLGALFAPSKALHDAIDGARPLRDGDCDRHGFTRRGEHEFRLSLGGGVVWPVREAGGVAIAESHFAVRTRVIAIDEYGVPGRGSQAFGNANLSELRFSTGLSAVRWTDFSFATSIVPAGAHWRSITGRGAGPRHGDEIVAGVLLGAEYSVHRYDVAAAGKDRLFALQGPGAMLLYRRHAGGARLELEVQAAPTFAGVEAFALETYLARGRSDGLTSVAELEGYNHAVGFTLFPRVRLRVDPLELGAEIASFRAWAIQAFDRFPERTRRQTVSEGRDMATTWVSLGGSDALLRLTLRGAALHRFGSFGPVSTGRTEWRLGAAIDTVL